MFVVVFVVGREAQALQLAPLVAIALQIAIGGVTYMASSFLFAAPTAREFVRLARETISRRQGRAA